MIATSTKEYVKIKNVDANQAGNCMTALVNYSNFLTFSDEDNLLTFMSKNHFERCLPCSLTKQDSRAKVPKLL